MVISLNESLSHQSPPQVRGAQKICVQQEVPAFEGNLSLLWSNVSFVILRYVRFVIFPQDLWSSASSQSPRERCFSVSNTLFPASFKAQFFHHTQKKNNYPKHLTSPPTTDNVSILTYVEFLWLGLCYWFLLIPSLMLFDFTFVTKQKMSQWGWVSFSTLNLCKTARTSKGRTNYLCSWMWHASGWGEIGWTELPILCDL